MAFDYHKVVAAPDEERPVAQVLVAGDKATPEPVVTYFCEDVNDEGQESPDQQR